MSITHEEAKEIVGGWLEHHWIETDMAPYDLTPILADIERVNAHLEAEHDRIAAARAAVLADHQAAADLLPRKRYRLVYGGDDRAEGMLLTHRTPIDCWSGDTYDGRPAGLYLHLDNDLSVRHGDILEVLARKGEGELWDCQCIREAIVEATDEWVARVGGVGCEFGAVAYHPTPGDVEFHPLPPP